MYLNYLANYVPNAWNYEHGCSHCDDDLVDLSQLQVSDSNQVVFCPIASPLVCFATAAVPVIPADTGNNETYPA